MRRKEHTKIFRLLTGTNQTHKKRKKRQVRHFRSRITTRATTLTLNRKQLASFDSDLWTRDVRRRLGETVAERSTRPTLGKATASHAHCTRVRGYTDELHFFRPRGVHGSASALGAHARKIVSCGSGRALRLNTDVELCSSFFFFSNAR